MYATCTRFHLCEISATGSVDTEQSAPINIIICLVGDDTWSTKLRTPASAEHFKKHNTLDFMCIYVVHGIFILLSLHIDAYVASRYNGIKTLQQKIWLGGNSMEWSNKYAVSVTIASWLVNFTFPKYLHRALALSYYKAHTKVQPIRHSINMKYNYLYCINCTDTSEGFSPLSNIMWRTFYVRTYVRMSTALHFAWRLFLKRI